MSGEFHPSGARTRLTLNWRMSEIHEEPVRNFLFFLHSSKRNKTYFCRCECFCFPAASFRQFNSSHFGLWLNLSTSSLWDLNTLVAIAKPKPPHSPRLCRRSRQLCVALYPCSVYQLVNYPATWGRRLGRQGGDYEERVGLAFGCNTTQLVLILNSGWLSHARSQSEIKYISGTSVTVFMWWW